MLRTGQRYDGDRLFRPCSVDRDIVLIYDEIRILGVCFILFN